MTRKELIKKYRDVLVGMYAHYPDSDNDTLLDMLIYENDVRHKRRERIDTYEGIPETFDFEAFEADLK